MNIIKSIVIDKDLEEVKKVINDYHTWPKWSPWLIAEPEAQVEIDQDGKHYSWDGKVVGAGEMTIEMEEKNKTSMELKFLKPWKSTNHVYFDFQEQSNGATQVQWTMAASLPFYLFWMKKQMAAFIGSDLERGLKMLQSYIEKGKIDSKVEYLGIQNQEAIKYVGIEKTLSFADMEKEMGADFEKLMTAFQAGNGNWFTIYEKFDLVKDKIHYKSCVGVDQYSEGISSEFIQGELPACQVYVTRHTGSYDFIGNAWSSAMMKMRAKAFKAKKKNPPFEMYRNSPKNTPEAELISDICFVVKE